MMSSPAHPGAEVAVILDAWPRIHTISKGAAGFDFAGDYFQDVGLGIHNGFYDFLRSRNGTILGLRYLPDPEAEVLLAGVPVDGGLRFASDGGLRVLLIFLGEEQDFDPETSSDQYFGDNAIYRGKNSGTLAIAFAIDLLSPAERTSFLNPPGSVPE
jgi:hypothetical protein